MKAILSVVLLFLLIALQGCNHKTALLKAAYDCDYVAIDNYLIRGGFSNLSDNLGNTILMYAVSGRCVSVSELLIMHGADVNASTNKGDTVYVFALGSYNSTRNEWWESIISEIKNEIENTKEPLVIANLQDRLLRIEELYSTADTSIQAQDKAKTILTMITEPNSQE